MRSEGFPGAIPNVPYSRDLVASRFTWSLFVRSTMSCPVPAYGVSPCRSLRRSPGVISYLTRVVPRLDITIKDLGTLNGGMLND